MKSYIRPEDVLGLLMYLNKSTSKKLIYTELVNYLVTDVDGDTYSSVVKMVTNSFYLNSPSLPIHEYVLMAINKIEGDYLMICRVIVSKRSNCDVLDVDVMYDTY